MPKLDWLSKQLRLQYAEEELERARDQLDQSRPRPDKIRVLWVDLAGANLRGVTIASVSNAFQRASFQSCDLQDATLEGGGAAFQFAQFDNASLANAKLTGGGASFQLATFVNADLTGAVLSGGGASFQRASFENATLVRARLIGDFQLANISNAHFEAADLSALDSDSLASCYFKEAPTYDEQTIFPDGFDPEQHLWEKAGK